MKKSLFPLLILLPAFLEAQKPVIVYSPDKNIRYTFQIKGGQAFYDISYKSQPVIVKALLALSFLQSGEFDRDLKADRPSVREGEEKYELVTGKAKDVDQFYNEVMISLAETKTPFRKIHLRVRAFNDGVGFRYEFPSTGDSVLLLTDEQTHFHFPGDPHVLSLQLPNYTSSHEGEYTYQSLSEVKEDTLMDMPALFELSGPLYVAVTEANLFDYPGMYLSRIHDDIVSRLSPLPHQPEIKARLNLPHSSPWRVLMISDRIGALLETNILTSLSEPCRVKDVSWLKPGKTTFPWWNGNVVPDTINAPGNNFVTNQYYIDFCARNHIEYHSVVEYGLHQWYTDDGVGFQPGPHSDVTKPVPGLDMKEICDYAAQHGVGIRVWVHWAALYPKLDTAFDVFEKWGLKGMMVDFMDRDDQEMVNIQTEILQKAAAHHLHIQFHGAYKPTGETRTYPNELTREGTLNYEVNKWDKRITPDHDLNIAFTRLLAGPTDYHLGGFRAVPDSLFRIQYTRPLMLGTRCHMLAMYVVLQSPLGMVCDYPEAYEGQPGFEFVREVPTNWDETRVPAANFREYLSIARRKDKDWYAGIINNHQERDFQLPLDFLGNGNFNAEIYSDADDVMIYPNHLKKEIRSISNKDIINIHLAAGGGSAIHFRKID